MTQIKTSAWDKEWSSVSDTVSHKDLCFLIDEIKLEYLKSLLNKNDRRLRILEIGCGSGRLSCFFSRENHYTYCLDHSQEALRVAVQNYKTMKTPGFFTMGDGYKLPFKQESFDVVLSTGLLEHFENPAPIVHSMIKVLKKEGLFFSDIVPDKFSLFRSLDFISFRKMLGKPVSEKEILFERGFKKEEIHELLKGAGLNNIKVFPSMVLLPRKLFPPSTKMLASFGYYLHKSFKYFIKRLDDTSIAEAIGLCYIASGIKD